MSEISNVGSSSGNKGVAPLKPKQSQELSSDNTEVKGTNIEDTATISAQAPVQEPPKNDLQKVEEWTAQLMDEHEEVDQDRVNEVRERLASGYYDNAMEGLLDGLESELRGG